MNDLISRSALIALYNKWLPQLELPEDAGDKRGVETCIAVLEAFSTIDAVEVVRCKDCKHRIDDEDFVRGHYCMKRPSNGGYFCEDNDFCSYGERKEVNNYAESLS